LWVHCVSLIDMREIEAKNTPWRPVLARPHVRAVGPSAVVSEMEDLSYCDKASDCRMHSQHHWVRDCHKIDR
jgi:hypothetical protein